MRNFCTRGAVLALTCVVAITFSSNRASAQFPGLIHYWTFDAVDIEGDTMKDRVGDNVGFIDGAESGPGAPGLGQGLEFDGLAQVVFAEPLSFEANYTVMAWASALNWDPGNRKNTMDSWSPGGPSTLR